VKLPSLSPLATYLEENDRVLPGVDVLEHTLEEVGAGSQHNAVRLDALILNKQKSLLSANQVPTYLPLTLHINKFFISVHLYIDRYLGTY